MWMGPPRSSARKAEKVSLVGSMKPVMRRPLCSAQPSARVAQAKGGRLLRCAFRGSSGASMFTTAGKARFTGLTLGSLTGRESAPRAQVRLPLRYDKRTSDRGYGFVRYLPARLQALGARAR